MRIQPTQQNNPTFQYNSPLKTLWREGKFPNVVKGIYGGVLKRDNCTLEHLKAHSRGGASALSNYALATKRNNNARGNEPLKRFLTWEMANKYLAQFKDILVEGFDGNKYIHMIKNTLTKLIGKEK